jgi:Tol biopolymer transport system component
MRLIVFFIILLTFGNALAQVKPQLFAEGIITSAENDELFITFTPNMKTLYFSKRVPGGVFTIHFSEKKNGTWTTPQVAPFSGKFKDQAPFISPDGKKLFFSSNRPLQGNKPKEDNDIWVVKKSKSGWSEPENLGAPLNTNLNEANPSVDAKGNLYFWVLEEMTGGLGKSDIWVSRLVNGKYRKPENAGNVINSEYYESSAYISPDGKFMIFCRDDVPGDLGRADIYISHFRQGKWTKPQHLGVGINSSAFDFAPLVSPDKKYFFFSSNRTEKTGEIGKQNIYFVEFKDLGVKLK